jgi:hypothetical protein
MPEEGAPCLANCVLGLCVGRTINLLGNLFSHTSSKALNDRASFTLAMEMPHSQGVLVLGIIAERCPSPELVTRHT